MKQHGVTRIAEIAVLVFSICLTIGIRTLFKACDAKEDGSWMTCHWAEQAVFAVSVAILIAACALVFYNGRGHHGVKAGISFAIAVQAAVCIAVPGVFIGLCMMDTMRCHTVMRPAVIVVCLLVCATAVISCYLNRKQCGMHHRTQEPV